MPTEQNDLSLAVIHGLGGSEYSGKCRCPCHDDERPSLEVKAGHSGNVIVKCWAGCSQDRVLTELRRRGFTLSAKERDYENRKATREHQRIEHERQQTAEAKAEQKRRRAWGILRRATADLDLVARYLSGRGFNAIPPCVQALSAKQCRKEFDRRYPAMVVPIIKPKVGVIGAQVTFLARDGSTKLNIEKPRLIYGNVKGGYVVVRKLDATKPLLEGEGFENVRSASQITRGLPGIAALGAWNLPNIIPPPCPELILVGDNDKTGIEYARKTARLLTAGGWLVRIAIPPDPYNDWNEVLRSIRSEAERAYWERYILEAEMEEEADPAGYALSMEDIMSLAVEPREYLLKPWLETGSINMCHAQRGHGKTRFMMAVAYAIATGSDFLLWPVQRSAKTLYIDGELPLSLLQKRLQQLGQPSPNLTVLSRDVLLRRGITLPDLAEAEGRDFTDAIVEALGIEVIILDSLSTLIRSGVENEAESWTPIQDWLLSHRFHGRTIIIIHHEGRSKKPRGTSKREDIMDTIVRLNELEPDDSQPRENQSTFEISFTKTREFYGSAKAALIVKQSTASGVAQWSYEFARDHLHQRVDELKRQGLTQKDIARQLGVSQPQVSRILTDLSVRRRGSAQAEETTEADVEILDRPR